MITLDEWWDSRSAEYKDRMNPGEPGDGSCVYTDQYDDHCIAGQYLEDVGLGAPSYGHRDNSIGFRTLAFREKYRSELVTEANPGEFELVMTDDAKRLVNLQTIADDRHWTWGETWALTDGGNRTYIQTIALIRLIAGLGVYS